MAQKVSYIVGAILVIVGVWGYFQDPVLGFFEVNGLHNLVHLVSGVVLILAGVGGAKWAKLGLQVFGVIYALVAIIGLTTSGDTILGLIESNLADDLLHVALAVILLYFGFVGGKTESSSMSTHDTESMGGTPHNPQSTPGAGSVGGGAGQ